MTVVMLVNTGATVMAGSINEYEAELIAIGEGVFYYNGVEYVATDAAKLRVRNYLMQDDVNLSASQAQTAKDEFWGNLFSGISNGYLVPLNPQPDNSGTTGGNVSGGNSGGGATGGVNDTPVAEPGVQYTYTELIATMYAKQAVNVRNQPSTDGERIGSLSENQEVRVLAQCVETGWYCIAYNDVIAYVSNNYLTDVKPESDTETTESDTEIENTETEQMVDATEDAETNTATESGVTEDTETATTETESEVETETEEVVLREKNFNKGLDMTTVAMITGGIALAVAVIIVISHKNRRF